MKNVLTVIFAVALLTSCGNTLKTATKKETRAIEAQTAIENKRWVLQKLSGNPIPKGQPDIYISFKNASAFNGNGGCNGFSGHYMIDTKTISLKDIVSTRMACPNLETETKFLNVLQQADGYKVMQDNFSLLHGNDEIASFAAIYLK